jgi:hypothetical protein
MGAALPKSIGPNPFLFISALTWHLHYYHYLPLLSWHPSFVLYHSGLSSRLPCWLLLVFTSVDVEIAELCLQSFFCFHAPVMVLMVFWLETSELRVHTCKCLLDTLPGNIKVTRYSVCLLTLSLWWAISPSICLVTQDCWVLSPSCHLTCIYLSSDLTESTILTTSAFPSSTFFASLQFCPPPHLS